MHIKNIYGVETITIQPIMRIDPDSYIRLTFDEFRQLPLVHLISGLDEDKPILLPEGAIYSDITGYTEWVSDTMPAVSVGWDWMIQSTQVKGEYYKRISEPRSNLMLVNAQQRDLGPTKTAALIETVIDKIAWKNVISQYISTRYM